MPNYSDIEYCEWQEDARMASRRNEVKKGMDTVVPETRVTLDP